MASSVKSVISPGVGDLMETSPAVQIPQSPGPTPRPAEKASDADCESDSLDRSFLMTLLRALSAWST